MIKRYRLKKGWASIAIAASLLLSTTACNEGGADNSQPSLIVYTTQNQPASAEATEETSKKASEAQTKEAEPTQPVSDIILTTEASSDGEEPTESSSMPETDLTWPEETEPVEQTTQETSEPEPVVVSVPKYIFLFVGDGMGYSHIQGASYYKAATEGTGDGDAYSGALLNFMQFPVTGTVINYNSDSYITDSASAITAITSGSKTVTDRINISPSGEELYETIAEKLKKQKNYQIGVVSNANINHATPAGFYAHQLERTMYYEIGQEILVSDFNYFGGGSIRNPKGKDGTWKDLYDLIAANGYEVYRSDEGLSQLKEEMNHVLITSNQSAEGQGMYLAMDAPSKAASLADYVRGGITVMADAEGFFFGIESGLSDWAAHENDAGSLIKEIFVLEDAVAEALKFYEQHPDETLIIVTADHETGGFSLGTSNQGYQLYPQGLLGQKISYYKYLVDYVNRYRSQGASWDDMVWEMRSLFGLTIKNTYQAGDDPKLLLTEEEEQLLLKAFQMSMAGSYAEFGTAAYGEFGDGDPLAHTVVTLLGKKCGFDFTSVYHTAENIPIYAIGCGSENFSGVLDNTEIAKRLEALLGVE